MEQIARAQRGFMHELRILQTAEVGTVIVLKAGIETVVVLTNVTGYDVTIGCQACRVVRNTHSGMDGVLVRLAVVQHEQSTVAGGIVKLFQPCAYSVQVRRTEVRRPVVPADIGHRLQVITC